MSVNSFSLCYSWEQEEEIVFVHICGVVKSNSIPIWSEADYGVINLGILFPTIKRDKDLVFSPWIISLCSLLVFLFLSHFQVQTLVLTFGLFSLLGIS